MLSSLTIEGFRCFEYFEMKDLGRVNLLVGRNNSGKSSVLEAVYLLYSDGDERSLKNVLWRRGEQFPTTVLSVEGPPGAELDVAHLFNGHKLEANSKIQISGSNHGLLRRREYIVAKIPKRGAPGIIAVRGTPPPEVEVIETTPNAGLLFLTTAQPFGLGMAMTFLTPDSMASEDLVHAWDQIALTPLEGMVVEALRVLDPEVERIAPQSTGVITGMARRGFIVKRRDVERPVPIGSMGEGMWRMLAMAIALTQCRGGVLLVDEIDTGLHYSVMSKMWRLIYQTAVQLDVQVFATTHSYDCVYSLAQLCAETSAHGEVTVQRIEAGKKKAIPYGEDEIAVAAERDIEVR